MRNNIDLSWSINQSYRPNIVDKEAPAVMNGGFFMGGAEGGAEGGVELVG